MHYLVIFLLQILMVFPLLKAEEPAEPVKKEEVVLSQVESFNRFASRFITIGDFEKANHFIYKALEIEPKNLGSLILLTNILVKTEKFEEAREAAKNAFPNSKFEQLFFLTDKCLEVEPAPIRMRMQALAWAIEAQALNKNLDKWFGHLLAKAYFRNNNIDKAIEIAKPFIEREPKNTRFNVLFGNIYTKKGEYEIATSYLAKVMNKEPLKAMCFNHISYQLLTYDDEADNRPIIALSYALLASDATQQKIPDVEDTIALAYFKTNDFNNAIVAQKRAVKLLKDELPLEQIERSTKLMGFKKQLLIYEEALKNNMKDFTTEKIKKTEEKKRK